MRFPHLAHVLVHTQRKRQAEKAGEEAEYIPRARLQESASSLFSAAFPMLSRACLGKMIIFSIKWHRKRFAALASGAMPLSHVYNQSTTAHTIDEMSE